MAARRREFNFLFSVLFPLFCFNIFSCRISNNDSSSSSSSSGGGMQQLLPISRRRTSAHSGTLVGVAECDFPLHFVPLQGNGLFATALPPSTFRRHLPYLKRQVSWDYTFYALLQFSSNYLNGWQCLISRIRYSFYLQN